MNVRLLSHMEVGQRDYGSLAELGTISSPEHLSMQDQGTECIELDNVVANVRSFTPSRSIVTVSPGHILGVATQHIFISSVSGCLLGAVLGVIINHAEVTSTDIYSRRIVICAGLGGALGFIFGLTSTYCFFERKNP